MKKIEPKKKMNKEGGGRRFINQDAEKIGNKNEEKKIVNQVGWADAPLPIRFVQIKNETHFADGRKKKKKFDVDTNKIKKKWNLPISSVGSESIAATVST